MSIAPTPASPFDSAPYDVAIAGGGLVGGTLACALAGRGLRIAMIDRLAPAAGISPAFDGRASAIALSGQRLLEAVGLWPLLAAEAEPIREIRVSDGASPLFLHYDHADLAGGDGRGDPLGFMLENRCLRRALATRIAGMGGELTVIAPTAVTGFTQDADFARLTLGDGRVINTRLAVAAEGRASVLRTAAGVRVTGWDYRQTGIVATIAHEVRHGGIAHERFLPSGPFAILPLTDDDQGRHRSSLVWTERNDLAGQYLALSDDAFLAEIDARIGGFLGALGLVGPRFSYPLNLQVADSYVRGRLVLVGDTAHGIHPIAGQGLNLGLRDVAALTEIIVEARQLGLDPAHPTGLARYQRWRRGDNLLMAGVTDVLNRLFSNDVAPLKAARDIGLGIVNGIKPLKLFFMRHAMGTVGELPKLMRGEVLR